MDYTTYSKCNLCGRNDGKNIKKECFASCYKLQKITIPYGTKERFEKLLDKNLHKFLIEK